MAVKCADIWVNGSSKCTNLQLWCTMNWNQLAKSIQSTCKCVVEFFGMIDCPRYLRSLNNFIFDQSSLEIDRIDWGEMFCTIGIVGYFCRQNNSRQNNSMQNNSMPTIFAGKISLVIYDCRHKKNTVSRAQLIRSVPILLTYLYIYHV